MRCALCAGSWKPGSFINASTPPLLGSPPWAPNQRVHFIGMGMWLGILDEAIIYTHLQQNSPYAAVEYSISETHGIRSVYCAQLMPIHH